VTKVLADGFASFPQAVAAAQFSVLMISEHGGKALTRPLSFARLGHNLLDLLTHLGDVGCAARGFPLRRRRAFRFSRGWRCSASTSLLVASGGTSRSTDLRG
jgi:hypothetical protein